MKNIELGYEVATMDEIMEDLIKFYREQDTARPLMGDFQLGSELLCRIQTHNNVFNMQRTSNSPPIKVSGFF